MLINSSLIFTQISRRGVLGTAAAMAATPALAEVCPIGPPAHEKGPRVWMDMDQVELDAAYDQSSYDPLLGQILKRYASRSNETRARLGAPKRFAYGPTPMEALDLYPAKTPNAPIFVFMHGGAWLRGEAKDYGFPAELFVRAGPKIIARTVATPSAEAAQTSQGIDLNTVPLSGHLGGGGQFPTDASAPGRNHQPCGGCRETPSPSTLARWYARYSADQGRLGW